MSEEIVEKQDYKLDELVKAYLTIRNASDNLYRQYMLKKEELESELVGDEMKQLIKEFINPENIKNRDKKLENRRKPNNLQPDNKVDPSEGIALSPRNLPGRE